MAPKPQSTTSENINTVAEKEKYDFVVQIVWKNVVLFLGYHLAALYGLYLMFTSAMWQTNTFAFLLYIVSGLGITAGAHRLWAHRSYKAKFPLRLLLAFLNTIAYQNDIYQWGRNHRSHHKYSETNADPHNARRGFFFAHVGWLLVKKQPEVIQKGKQIDLSDLLADPIVRYQRKFYGPLSLICCFALPTLIPMYSWGESLTNSFFVSTILRYVFALNMTFLVNSAAHMWGARPYDPTIQPGDNLVINLLTDGEGFHNYHHTFPFDYASSEYGLKLNITTAFIDLMAWLGQAYDRKRVSPEMIKARREKTILDNLQKAQN